MNLCILLMLAIIPVLRVEAYWKIKWSNEFNNLTNLNLEEWRISNDEIACNGIPEEQLNCRTNRSRNIWLLEETLAIAAVPESPKYLNKEYTSALISTKEVFTYGKFEIRAALPNGKLLRPAMYLTGTKKSGNWPKDGQIDIMTNLNDSIVLGSGIHYLDQFNQPRFETSTPNFETLEDLNKFHSYIVEWNQSVIIWKFDETIHLQINLTEKFTAIHNPFKDPFRIVVTLGVGGKFFGGSTLSKQEANQWPCSLLILDYIRVYDWIEGYETENITDLPGSTKRVSDPAPICNAIMPFLRLPERIEKIEKFAFTTVFTVFSLILLLAFILFAVYMFIRKTKRTPNKRQDEQNYDDVDIDQENYYQDYNECHEYDQYENSDINVDTVEKLKERYLPIKNTSL